MVIYEINPLKKNTQTQEDNVNTTQKDPDHRLPSGTFFLRSDAANHHATVPLCYLSCQVHDLYSYHLKWHERHLPVLIYTITKVCEIT